jgi:Septum formation
MGSLHQRGRNGRIDRRPRDLHVFANLAEELAAESEDITSPAAENPASRAAETTISHPQEETAPAKTDEVDIVNLKVGDCLAESPDAEQIVSVSTAPCAEPHSEEIYAAVTLPEGDEDFPGFEVIDTQAEDMCIAEFNVFVQRTYVESALDFGFITPTEEGWHDGDRLVLCTIYDPNEALTSGSLRGARR